LKNSIHIIPERFLKKSGEKVRLAGGGAGILPGPLLKYPCEGSILTFARVNRTQSESSMILLINTFAKTFFFDYIQHIEVKQVLANVFPVKSIGSLII